jgi:hypothetical protein
MLEENSEDASLRSYLDYLIFRYVSVAYCEDIPLQPSLPSMCRGIDSFECEQSKPYFRFEKEQLHTLYTNLKFPDVCKMDNGIVMGGEDVFSRGFYELARSRIKLQKKLEENILLKSELLITLLTMYMTCFLDY